MKPEQDKKPDDMWSRLEKDFTVKNMPAFSRFSGTSYEGAPGAKAKVVSEGSHEAAKSTGLIIIGSGIVVVAVIFYLAYRFLILPAMQREPVVIPEEDTNTVINEEVQVPAESIILPDPVVEVVATGTATVTPEVLPEITMPMASDADNDGLSDAAELFLGTNPQAQDSDNDTYSDRQELLGGYDPSGGGKLTDNRKLALYAPSEGDFALIYPSTWEVNAVNPTSILFSAPDQSFIQMYYEDHDEEYTDVLAWYKTQFTDASGLTAERFIDSNFGPGILSADGQIAYYLGKDGKRVYVLSYIKSGETAPYLEIFKMMALTVMKL